MLKARGLRDRRLRRGLSARLAVRPGPRLRRRTRSCTGRWTSPRIRDPAGRADEVVPAALEWWRERGGKPRFLWVHVYDPHAPYDPPEPYRPRFRDDPYLGEVAFTDAALAPLLEAVRATVSRSAPRRHRRPRRGPGRSRRADARPLRLRGDAARPPLPLVAGPRRGPGATRSRRATWTSSRRSWTRSATHGARELPGSSLLSRTARRERPRDSYFESLSASFNRGWAPAARPDRRGAKSTSTCRCRSSTTSRPTPARRRTSCPLGPDALRRLRKRLLELPDGPGRAGHDRLGGGGEAAQPRLPLGARREESAPTAPRTIRRT